MSGLPTEAKKGKIGFLFVLILIAGGSAAILAPAWLPNEVKSLPSEGSSVEILQILFLAISSALFFGASYHVGRLKPIYFGFGLGGLAATVGEIGNDIDDLIAPLSTETLLIPVFIWIGWSFLRKPKEFSRFWGYASKAPASGFLVAAIIIAYVFGEIFGSKAFWQASLGEQFDSRVPKIVEAYLGLLATYFTLVAAIGFCLPVTKKGRVRKQRKATANSKGN